MNYTEEQYSELYNNLPKGLRDLVLTGALSAQVGALAMKYGLTPEEQSELEPAIEDVALGLITPEELSENIFIQVGLDEERAQTLASEAMRSIYSEHLEELRLTRKYKIELDTQIRSQQSVSEENADEPVVDTERAPVASNIINITRDSEPTSAKSDSRPAEEKVADWFAGKKSISGRAAMDALGETDTQPRSVPIQKIPEVPTKKTEVAPPLAETAKSAWQQITSDTPNNLKPASAPLPTPSKTVPATGDKNFEKSLVQVEQQILTLTQSVNKMIDQNSKTINPVVQSVFNSGQYEEVSRRMDAMNHRIDDLQAKLITLIDQHKKDIVHVEEAASKREESAPNKEEVSPVDRIIKIKKEESGQPIKASTLTSTVNKDVLDGIFVKKQPAPEYSGNTITITKQTEIKKEEPVPTNTRSNARETLLRDLEDLKKGLLKKEEPVSDTTPTAAAVNPSPSASEGLREEISPSTDFDKMKALQDKIKSLNKGITQGGIVSAGSVSVDPYKL